MNMDVLILGVIQGLTEFLPVSSSGHLALAQIFFGMEMPPLSYDLVLHVATALATLIFFMRDILEIAFEWFGGFVNEEKRRSRGWPTGWAVIVGTVITGAIGIMVKDYAELAAQNSLLVGCGLMFTGVVLIASRFIKSGVGVVNVKDGVFVGLAQCVALMPGISRSGMTIMMGQSIGLDKSQAFRFSFLLSLPAIFGATLLQAMETGGWESFVSSLPAQWYIGAATAFATGLLALVVLKKLVIASKWWGFGVYCFLLGGAAVFTTFLGVW
ncbi:undecaprenyl-diphosphate phosphatase [Synergistaceae bacterium OttesenSCG-928-D05]|nr:undecaprenyl-diphosphate phosphatase [Synergistaceae bacterium OttesenSCG-928-D05]